MSDAVRSLFAAIEAGDPAALERLYHPDIVQVEWPNALKPKGGRRTLGDMRRDFERGKNLLRGQSYEVLSLTGAGDRVVAEVLWTGVLAVATGKLAPGDRLTAHCCIVFDLRDGRIAAQRNYDCFEAFS